MSWFSLQEEEIKDFFINKSLVFDSNGVPRKARAYLEGINVSRSTTIGSISIRPIEGEDKIFLKKIGNFSDYTSVMELLFCEKKEISRMYCEPLDIMERSLIVFRLLYDEWMGMSPIYFLNEKGIECGRVGNSKFGLAYSRYSDKNYVLTKDRKDEFKNIFAALYSRNMQGAVSRYDKGCSENYVDSIIDFVIALESTLGFGLNSEISHRLSIRGAYVLAPTIEKERRDYYNLFRYLYDLRSKIVHGVFNGIKLPQGKQRAAIRNLGYRLENDEGDSFYQGDKYVADLARSVTRKVLRIFLEDTCRLDSDWLTQLELGGSSELGSIRPSMTRTR